MPSLRVAIYARVSSDQQVGGTVASQVAALEARVIQEGLRLEPDHRFIDDGYSGATLIRPALERLRDAIAAGAIDRLYVHSPDRLARRYAYQVLLIDEFQRAGIEVAFLNRPLGRSAEDDLLLQVQGMIAEYERAKILERSRRGKKHAASSGSVNVLAGAPYGYRYLDRHVGGGEARYEIIDDQAQVVRKIFHWVGVERLSIGEVCRRLRRAGHRSPSGKESWDRTTVWGMLKNPAYQGAAAFGKTRVGPLPARLRPVRGGAEQPRRPVGIYDVPPDEWITVPVPAMVDSEVFEAVQAQLEENRRRSRQGARGERFLLQGLIVCKQCGYAYYGKAISLAAGKGRRRDYAYYRCCGSDAYRFGGQRLCSNPQVRTDRLDAAVWREVEDLLGDPRRLAAEYERRLVEIGKGDPSRSDAALLDGQIAKLNRGIGRLIDGYAEGLIDKTEFEPRLTGLRRRLAGLEQQRQALLDQEALRTTLSLLVGRLEDFAGQVRGQLAQVDWHRQRELIRLLVKRVEIDRDAISIVFRVAPLSAHPSRDGPQMPFLPDCRRGDDRSLRASRHRRPSGRFGQNVLLEKAFDQVEDAPVADQVRHSVHQTPVRDRVEVLFQIGVHHPGVAVLEPPIDLAQGVSGASAGPEAVAAVPEPGFQNGFDHQFDSRLHDPVLDGRNAQRTGLAVRLGDVHPPDRLRPIAAGPQRGLQFLQVPIRLMREQGDALPVHARRPFVARHSQPRLLQGCRTDHLVNQTEPLASFDAVAQRRHHGLGPDRRFHPTPVTVQGFCPLLSRSRHCRDCSLRHLRASSIPLPASLPSGRFC
jgi:site-specific DNA recombinase